MTERRKAGRVDSLMQDATSMVSDKMGDVMSGFGELEK